MTSFLDRVPNLPEELTLFDGEHFALFSISPAGISWNVTLAFARGTKAGSELLVRLTLKLANLLDGLDVTAVDVGDVIELSRAEAIMLIAEGWAEQVHDDAVAKVHRQSSGRERSG